MTVIVVPYYAADVDKERVRHCIPLPVIDARECMLLCTTVWLHQLNTVDCGSVSSHSRLDTNKKLL